MSREHAEDGDRLGQRLAGRYEILEKLGAGGMGAVYRARQMPIERDVAVKIMHPWLTADPDARERFIREMKIARRVRHPNVIELFDFGETPDGAAFMVLELLHGRGLDDLIAEQSPLPWRRAVRVARQICDGLAAAHRAGIWHRDLKPDNIHLEDQIGHPDHVKILDFGLARVEADSRMTQAGTVLGTPAYMSPEQAGGEHVDARSDIYALGAILYECLSGQRCFEDGAGLELLLRKLNEEAPPLPPEIIGVTPPALVDIVTRSLARQPDQRFASVDELKAALERVERSAPPDKAVPTPPTRPAPWRERAITEERAAATPPPGTPRVRMLLGRPISQERLPWPVARADQGMDQACGDGQPPPSGTNDTQLRRRAGYTTADGKYLKAATRMNLQHAPSGNRFTLVATGDGIALLEYHDRLPRPGIPFVIDALDPVFSGVRIRVTMIGVEDLGDGTIIRVAIHGVAAPSPWGLRSAVYLLLRLDLSDLNESYGVLEAGALLLWDHDRQALSISRPPPPVTGVASPDRRPVSANELLRVSSHKGARPRPPRRDG